MNYSTSELLKATGVSGNLFAQWAVRGHIALTSGLPGTGNHRTHEFRDVVQVAVIAELGRLGVPPLRSKKIWLFHVAPNVAFPRPGDFRLLIAARPDGGDHIVRQVWGDSDDGMGRPDAPVAFAVLRVTKLVERLRTALPSHNGDAQ